MFIWKWIKSFYRLRVETTTIRMQWVNFFFDVGAILYFIFMRTWGTIIIFVLFLAFDIAVLHTKIKQESNKLIEGSDNDNSK